VSFAHAFADLSGIPGDRLSDPQALSGLLLAAANAAGLNPADPPVVKSGITGTTALLICRGGHVALHAVPAEGLCYADIAGLGAEGSGRSVQPSRGLEVIVKRLGAREVRSAAR
jgi:S-adenosylmethionine/arginine decarboxylase-like enzyme